MYRLSQRLHLLRKLPRLLRILQLRKKDGEEVTLLHR